MATDHDGHTHRNELVKIFDAATVTAFEQIPHDVITVRLHQRGLSLDLTYGEAEELATVMEKVVKYVNKK